MISSDSFGKRIKAFRKQKGLSVLELSQIIGIKPRVIQLCEQDRKNIPKDDYAKIIASKFDVDYCWLIGMENNEKSRIMDPSQSSNTNSTSVVEKLKSDDVSFAKRYHIDPSKYERIPISEMKVSTRVMNCLKIKNVKTIEDFLNLNISDFAQIKGIGEKCIKETEDRIFRLGHKNDKTKTRQESKNIYFAKELTTCIKEIPENRKQHRIIPYILAYTSDYTIQKILFDILSNYVTFLQIIECPSQLYNNTPNTFELTKFLAWIKFDIEAMINELFLCIYKTPKMEIIIKLRSTGETLESVSAECGLSSQRICQIEIEVKRSFIYWNARYRILFLISAIRNGDIGLSEDNIRNVIGDKSSQFLYLIKRSKSKYYFYEESLDLFILKNEKYKKYLANCYMYIPKNLCANEIDNQVAMIAKNTDVSSELIYKIIIKQYKLIGNTYYYSKMSLIETYKAIFIAFYPHGINVSDDNEIQKFKNNIISNFCNIKLPKSDKSIKKGIVDIGILCNKNTYIHKSYLKIPEFLLKEIDYFILTSNRTVFSFEELFDHFEMNFQQYANVDNKYYFEGILNFFLKDKYFFSRDAISKKMEYGMRDEISDFIFSKKKVNKKELLIKYHGNSWGNIIRNIKCCSDILIFDDDLFVHSCTLHIEQSDFDLEKVINKRIKDIPISSKSFFEHFPSKYEDFLLRNNITTPKRLFSILKYMFYDKFNFSHDMIAKIL